MTLNDTVLGKNYYKLGKFLTNGVNSHVGKLSKKLTLPNASNNKKVLTNNDETVLYEKQSPNTKIINTNSSKATSPRLFTTQKFRTDHSYFKEFNNIKDCTQNYKSNDYIYRTKSKGESNPVIKSFRKIVII